MKLLRIYIVIIILPIYLSGQQKPDPSKEYQLRIGITKTYSLDTKESDLKAAFKIWTNLYTKKLLEKHDIEIDVHFTLYENLGLLDTDITKSKIDFISLPIQEYSKLNNVAHFEPTLSGNTTGNKFTRFVLLVHKNSKLETIKDIEGKSITMPDASLNELMKIWFEVELYKNKLPDFDGFFNNILIKKNENMAIHSVFFNKADCALVRESTFEISNELNPQIKSNLRVISISPNYIVNLTAIRKDYDPKIKEFIIDLITKLHIKPEGKQILNLFKLSRIHKLNEGDIENIKELFTEYTKYNVLTLHKK